MISSSVMFGSSLDSRILMCILSASIRSMPARLIPTRIHRFACSVCRMKQMSMVYVMTFVLPLSIGNLSISRMHGHSPLLVIFLASVCLKRQKCHRDLLLIVGEEHPSKLGFRRILLKRIIPNSSGRRNSIRTMTMLGRRCEPTAKLLNSGKPFSILMIPVCFRVGTLPRMTIPHGSRSISITGDGVV